MKILYYPTKNSIKPIKKAVVTIGVFDGIHKGHFFLLKKVIHLSRKIKGKSVVITFWPHPQQEKIIYPLSYRLKILDSIKIDICVIIKFNSRIAQISPLGFIKNILLKMTKPEYIIVGNNFRFGKDALGDTYLLREISLNYGFKVKSFAPVRKEGKIISSTYIRRLISEGEIEKANRLLVFPFVMLGKVIRGRSVGRILGFPTANLCIDTYRQIIPASGVYIVKAKILGKTLPALCYIGNRPTFSYKEPFQNISVEIHILDFDRCIYGKILEIEFIRRLRSQKRFSSFPELIEAIRNDILNTRNLFKNF